jgi:hypothetical protein
MPQIFHRSFNTVSKVSIFGAVFLLMALAWVLNVLARSSYVTGAHIARVQPLPFSHQHHVGELGIDCRYCHGSVEQSSFAGMPATQTCMNCHHEIWFGSQALEGVRESYKSGRPIVWQRVHNLAQFVYFDHSIHVHKGIGCVTCHGRVDEMPILYQEKTLLMEWCLECHRDPKPYLRPRDEVFSMAWTRSADSEESPERLYREYEIRSADQITSCSTCHR